LFEKKNVLIFNMIVLSVTENYITVHLFVNNKKNYECGNGRATRPWS
jgi:hypothetical protein